MTTPDYQVFSGAAPWVHFVAIGVVFIVWLTAHYLARRLVDAIMSAWRRRSYRRAWSARTEQVRIPAPRPYPPVMRDESACGTLVRTY